MYDENTAEKMKTIASAAMDSAQAKIDELNALGGKNRNISSSFLLEWQKWIGTISFSLVAIGGAFLAQGKVPNGYVFLSFVLFLVTGTWIMVEHKRQFERSAIGSSIEVDNFRPLYDDKKKAAFDLWEEPNSIQKHIHFLKQELKVTEYSKTLESLSSKELEHEKIAYTNDIWLAMFLTAVYLLLWPAGSAFGLSRRVSLLRVVSIYWLVWLLFILFALRDALGSKDFILQANKSKKSKLKSEAKHSEGYSQRIKSDIAFLEQKLKELNAK